MAKVTMLVEEGSLAGPIDLKTLNYIQRDRTLDPSYRDLIDTFHGGIPVKQYIEGKGSEYRIGRFLTILDTKSPLTGPFQPHFDQSGIDCRVARSILLVIDSESEASRALFYGERLLPFAALFAGEHHPDEMCLDRAYLNFLCFDYGTSNTRPPVVVWHAEKAVDAYVEWENDGSPTDDADVPAVDYTSFTERIADNFDEFLKLLRLDP